MSKILLFEIRRIAAGTLSFHTLEWVHINTMTHLFLSHHSTICSIHVRRIGMDSGTWLFPGEEDGPGFPCLPVIFGRMYS